MPGARRWSLSWRLLAMLFTLTTILFCLGAIQNWRASHAASTRLFDDSLRESAGLLLQLAQHEIAEHGQSLGIELLKAETQPGPYGFRFQVWTPDMQAGYLSNSLPVKPLQPFGVEGFGWAQIDGSRWRAYSMWNESRTLQIQIAQTISLRQALDRQALAYTAVSVGLLLAAAAVLIWMVLMATLRPLRRTAERVGERSEQDLRPVEAPDAPREVEPLITALNRLLQRVRNAMQVERRFTADAAHELRTPLAAIRANAQVMVGARDEAERAATAADLLASVDRATRLVEQLLALARADKPLADDKLREMDLAEVASEQLAMHAALAAQRGIELSGSLAPARLRADPALLSVLVRNLVDNALRYTPSGGRVRIVTTSEHGEAMLCVQDNGPGIPADERSHVLERFYRVAGAPSTGSGLGLSIVKRVADVHGARVDIGTGSDALGTAISVHFRSLAAG